MLNDTGSYKFKLEANWTLVISVIVKDKNTTFFSMEVYTIG